jgi:GcrA cell cycle regulator
MEWTEERTELLRGLWLQGLTASQIAARMGAITRNAVIGKAHRMGLSSRPSPIKQAVTPPPLVAKPQPPAKPPVLAGGGRACSWPVGDPKESDFHFCGAAVEPGRPYCAEHCAVAYQRKVEAA